MKLGLLAVSSDDKWSNGIILAAQINPSADGLTTGVSGQTLTLDVQGGTVPTCRITYVEAIAVNTAPTINLDVGGC